MVHVIITKLETYRYADRHQALAKVVELVMHKIPFDFRTDSE